MTISNRINSYIARKLYKILNSFADHNSKNITRNRRKLASYDTARFVDEFLFSTQTFEDRFALIDASLKEVRMDGLYLEFGVFRGVTINRIADRTTGKTVYGFDSFEGLPEDWRNDYKKGAFAIAKLPEVTANVKLLKGWFNDVLPGFVKEHPEPCAFIHIDCDLYSSTKTVFDLLENQIVQGTVIVFDEFFNYPGWRNGEFKALMELCDRKKFSVQYIGYCHKDEQVAIRIC